MKRVLNAILSVLKIILLFVSFALTFYIVMAMYQRLDKSILEALDVFIPYIILLILLLLNHVLGHKYVTSNMFYNITCCLVFSLFIFVCYRTMFDNYMLLNLRNSYNMSFYYFSDMILPFKALLYLLIGGNICLIVTGAIRNKEVVTNVSVVKHNNDIVKEKKEKKKTTNNSNKKKQENNRKK